MRYGKRFVLGLIIALTVLVMVPNNVFAACPCIHTPCEIATCPGDHDGDHWAGELFAKGNKHDLGEGVELDGDGVTITYDKTIVGELEGEDATYAQFTVDITDPDELVDKAIMTRVRYYTQENGPNDPWVWEQSSSWENLVMASTNQGPCVGNDGQCGDGDPEPYDPDPTEHQCGSGDGSCSSATVCDGKCIEITGGCIHVPGEPTSGNDCACSAVPYMCSMPSTWLWYQSIVCGIAARYRTLCIVEIDTWDTM